MRLLIIRHADPEYISDSLTAEGVREADALARRLASGAEGDVERMHLYTSPKGRARATAAPAEKLLGKVAGVEDWTRELSYWPRLAAAEDRPGEGGLAMWDLAASTVRRVGAELTANSQWALLPDIAKAQAPFEQLCAESDAFLARHGYVRQGHQYRIVKKNRDVVVVFCHGGFGLTWLAHLLHIPLATAWTSFYLPPSSVTTILFDERSPDFAAPRAIAVGDLGHLYKEQLLPLPISKYERPNAFGHWDRPSGVKANFW